MPEIHHNVNYYGSARIIKEYAGFPKWIPLPVGLQLAWLIVPGDIKSIKANEAWIWSSDIHKLLKGEITQSKLRTVGSPFLYLCELMKDEINREPKKGSIVFPAHSSHQIDVNYNYAVYVDMLNKLPDKYHPITICMYYVDIHKNRHHVFLESGFNVVSNGISRNDKEFLYNFIKNTADKEYAISNQMTSALVYAAALGVKSIYYGPEFEAKNIGNIHWNDQDVENVHRSFEREMIQYFKIDENNYKKQHLFALRQLGKDQMQPPEYLNKLLWKNLFTFNYVFNICRYYFEKSIYHNYKRLYYKLLRMLTNRNSE